VFIDSECLLVPYICENRMLCNGISALILKVYASPAVLQLIKEIKILWIYVALQWHDVATKYHEYQ
jgi:hypothetical protein